jgi:gamma-glutamyltranspeptidase / glutathione hydrolase
MVSSAHPLASAAGIEVLKEGGNAVDAAAATSLALGVVAPAFSGIGGGGFFMIHPNDGETVYLDYREVAPLKSTPGMFPSDSEGEAEGFANSMGYAAVGVPGTVAGLWTAVEKYGDLKFSKVAEPAIRLARRGFVINPFLGFIMANNVDNALQKFRRFKESGKEWLKDGKPYRKGERKTSPRYADILEAVAEGGPPAFYDGELARSIGQDMAANGGLVSEKDLRNYTVKERKSVKGTYKGYEVNAMPPPSLGGLAIVEVLNMLEDIDLPGMGLNSAETIAAMARALSLAWPDLKAKVADPSFTDVDVDLLSSKSHAQKLWFRAGGRGSIQDQGVGGQNWTTHLSVIDKERNVAALTESLECYFGSGVIVPGTGFFLNDTMHDFDTKPGGINSVAPGKRPVSSMTPTLLLKDGEPFLVAGSAGGPRIVTATLQTILNVVDHSLDVNQAVDSPRIHYQGSGPIRVESRVRPAVRKKLGTMGYETQLPNYVQMKPGFDVYFGGVHAIMVGKRGELRGAADGRRQGAVASY